ncbi:hypothetical protein [Reyranella sp. CPCC 100927]|uniref:hypothetical protein n=1 Tax=Reyranella sp. CPCC 100927 TaxID=2599616 RepID=UPI0011B502A4|nr:hypothetical protein [Reyranella sp. CPCC 100927]TWT15357.1 hypothetical protein FQU96_03100 [Reyranella sp. CPCC 100927]
MVRSTAALVLLAALAGCDGTSAGQTHALPPPPPLAEPTGQTPTVTDHASRPRPVYTPPPKAPTWTLMPSQRTSCGRNFC